MKGFKKLTALLMAGMLVMGSLSLGTVSAATGDRSITVAGLEKGDKVTFYKVLQWADDNNEAELHKAVSGWYWVAPFSGLFGATTGDNGQQKLKDAISPDNKLMLTDTLAGDIARALNTANNPVAVEADIVVGDDGLATHVFNGDNGSTTENDGLYVAIITPVDQSTVYNPVFVHLDSSTKNDSITPSSTSSYYGNTGAAKKSTIPVSKSFENTSDYNKDSGKTAKSGDVLSFTVTSMVPGYGNIYKSATYAVTDTMNGLELQTSEPITVTVNGTPLTENNQYTIEKDADHYKVTLDPTYLKTLTVATDLSITYKAKVKAGANTNVIKEKNTVELEYSHNPTTETDSNKGGDKKYQKDVTNHYTFSIDANNLIGPYEDRIEESGSELIKVAVDKNGNPIRSTIRTSSNVTTTKFQASPLAGAEFELLDANKQSFDPKRTATSDANGRINFSDLDAGTYYLQETKAPAGYVKNNDVLAIVITAEFEERNVTEYYDQEGNWYENKNDGTDLKPYTYKVEELKSYTVTYNGQASKYEFNHAYESKGKVTHWSISNSEEAPKSITNTQGVELPSTGGVGTTIFYMGGAILVLLAGVLLVSKRRIA